MKFHVRVLSKETGLSPINTYEFGNTKECIDFSRNYRFCSEYHYKEIGADIWSKVYFGELYTMITQPVRLIKY